MGTGWRGTHPRLYDRQLIQSTLEDGSTVEAWGRVMNNIPK